jgi:hypothetical protein
MKRILQALDGVATNPVVGSDDMSKFLSIVDKNEKNQILNEASNPHKVSLPVQMAMQHYQQPAEPKQEKAPSLFSKYYMQAEAEVAQEKSQKRQLINQYASMIAERVLMKEGKAVYLGGFTTAYLQKIASGAPGKWPCTPAEAKAEIDRRAKSQDPHSMEEGFGQQIAKKILMVARHYFQTHGTPEAELIQQGFKKDFNGNWFMPQYNTSGSGFDRKWSDARRMYGDPQTQKMNQQQEEGIMSMLAKPVVKPVVKKASSLSAIRAAVDADRAASDALPPPHIRMYLQRMKDAKDQGVQPQFSASEYATLEQWVKQQQVYGSLPEEYSTDDLSHNKMGAGPGLQSNEPVEEMAKEKQPPKPRNFVAKNMVNTGTQVHKDRKRAEKNGDNKHKKAIPAYESVLDEIAKDPCWDKYKMLGTKKKNGKTVPNCVKK